MDDCMYHVNLRNLFAKGTENSIKYWDKIRTYFLV